MLKKTSILAYLLISSLCSYAATLNESGEQLLGANGVRVNGAVYNVEFISDFCATPSNRCNENMKFTFTNEAEARAASFALFDQIFHDDTHGSREYRPVGCSDGNGCTIVTAYGYQPGPRKMSVVAARYYLSPGISNVTVTRSYYTDNPKITYAVWTLVSPDIQTPKPPIFRIQPN